MASSPSLKIFNPQGEYVASCKYYEDAAMIVAAYGDGAKVKFTHTVLIWTEGKEELSASESYDGAGSIMRLRVKDHIDGARARQAERHAKLSAEIKAASSRPAYL